MKPDSLAQPRCTSTAITLSFFPMTSRAWSQSELLNALGLYFRLPFGRMHSRTPEIVALASTINRTPDAVAMKLVQFASLDPDLRSRGIRGMRNTSVADRQVWDEFYGRWEALAEVAGIPDEPPADPENGQRTGRRSADSERATDALVETRVRRGQHFFRSAVLAVYESRCCVTGISSGPLLRASHIIPWSVDTTLRLDPRNGLCLNALHDAAFDRGLITLSSRFELRISRRLREEIPESTYCEVFGRHEGVPIRLPERFQPTEEMLEYHRSTIFCE